MGVTDAPSALENRVVGGFGPDPMLKHPDTSECIRFGKTENVYSAFPNILKRLIEGESFKHILDVGGGSNPLLAVEYVLENNLDYTVLDVSADELTKAPKQYKTIVKDIAAHGLRLPMSYDFIFSRFVAEHVKDARQFHENIYAALRPGGMAIHFFPTIYALPFLLNMILPERLGVFLLPGYRRRHGKFPAYYRWCIGPTDKAVQRLRVIGYDVIEYCGYYGHGYYDGIPLVRNLQGLLKELLVRYPVPCLTSFACVILRRRQRPV